jgi:ADP-ribosylglycohydrolase
LRQSTERYVSYEEAIKKVLLQGGDTDTNAKIVGNVMGALHGMDAIPSYMTEPVLAFDCTKNGNIRPLKYSVKEATKLISYL